MKKRIFILGGAFAVLLIAGILLNAQSGLYWNDFWRAQGDSAYVHGSGDRIEYAREGDEAAFSLSMNGRESTATLSPLAGGGWRWEFSDGWAMEFPAGWLELRQGDIAAEFSNGIVVEYWSDDEATDAEPVLIPTDLDAMGCRFGAAADMVREPFYGEDDSPVGESLFFVTEDGESVYIGEEWFGERREPEIEPVEIRNGARIPAYGTGRPYQNERGEYLLNPEALLSVRTGGGASVDKASLAGFLFRVAAGETGRRGDGYAIAIYLLCYLGGAAIFLWPEETALLGERWKYRNEPELSDAAIFMQRFGGGLLMATGVVVLFLSLFLH